ncbi:hypothetical protein [Polyangium aurulentum]|uniref:hypothetical protein n=1 Tax=Polyangium aurulentum TaxID=2567896 RepID=UPI0010AE7C2F|nr:hypothetical protein [Polyangium aurulentum]UQA63251.1 hypothetical protein E8A73_023410 [Polyangium aurulentum]
MKITRRMTITMELEVTLDAEKEPSPREARLLEFIAKDPAMLDRVLTAQAWTEAAQWMSDRYMSFDADIKGRSAGAVIEGIAAQMPGPDGDFYRDARRRDELTEQTEGVQEHLVAQVIHATMSVPDASIH